jgi:hypothetical protein
VDSLDFHSQTPRIGREKKIKGAVLMRITANGGLVRIAGDTGDAANEDRAVEQTVPAVERSDPGTAGWDPYEVWRTRVKATRQADGLPNPTRSED